MHVINFLLAVAAGLVAIAIATLFSRMRRR